MAKLNHISVEIDANFGSTFQQETALRMLEKIVRGWKAFYLSKHSKNVIDFRIINAEAVTHTKRRKTARLIDGTVPELHRLRRDLPRRTDLRG